MRCSGRKKTTPIVAAPSAASRSARTRPIHTSAACPHNRVRDHPRRRHRAEHHADLARIEAPIPQQQCEERETGRRRRRRSARRALGQTFPRGSHASCVPSRQPGNEPRGVPTVYLAQHRVWELELPRSPIVPAVGSARPRTGSARRRFRGSGSGSRTPRRSVGRSSVPKHTRIRVLEHQLPCRPRLSPQLRDPRGDVDVEVRVRREHPRDPRDVLREAADVRADERRQRMGGDDRLERSHDPFEPREPRIGERPIGMFQELLETLVVPRRPVRRTLPDRRRG